MQPLEHFSVRSYPAMGEVVSIFMSLFANWLFLIAGLDIRARPYVRIQHRLGMELIGGLLIPCHLPLTNQFLSVSSTLWVRNGVRVVIMWHNSLLESAICADFPVFFNPALMWYSNKWRTQLFDLFEKPVLILDLVIFGWNMCWGYCTYVMWFMDSTWLFLFRNFFTPHFLSFG